MLLRNYAKFEGKLLDLDGLESIDKDVARELASVKGRLGLGALKSIDREVGQSHACLNDGRALRLAHCSSVSGSLTLGDFPFSKKSVAW